MSIFLLQYCYMSESDYNYGDTERRVDEEHGYFTTREAAEAKILALATADAEKAIVYQNATNERKHAKEVAAYQVAKAEFDAAEAWRAANPEAAAQLPSSIKTRKEPKEPASPKIWTVEDWIAAQRNSRYGSWYEVLEVQEGSL